jgi:hypothetical protein
MNIFNNLYKIILLLVISNVVFSECISDLPVEGTLSISSCDPELEKCIPSEDALYNYMQKHKNDESIFSIALTTSPWRFYDRDMRIMQVEELSSMIQQKKTKVKTSIKILGSWSGVRPKKDTESLVEKLSKKVDNMPVEGMDGFLWIKPNGETYTTHQAMTLKSSGYYDVKVGDDVMVSLVSGWPAEYETRAIEEGKAQFIFRAAVAWDTYLFCPDKALLLFEVAADLSHSIAAYNAALMRMERGQKGDIEIAKRYINLAIKLGDDKAKSLLELIK